MISRLDPIQRSRLGDAAVPLGAALLLTFCLGGMLFTGSVDDEVPVTEQQAGDTPAVSADATPPSSAMTAQQRFAQASTPPPTPAPDPSKAEAQEREEAQRRQAARIAEARRAERAKRSKVVEEAQQTKPEVAKAEPPPQRRAQAAAQAAPAAPPTPTAQAAAATPASQAAAPGAAKAQQGVRIELADSRAAKAILDNKGMLIAQDDDGRFYRVYPASSSVQPMHNYRASLSAFAVDGKVSLVSNPIREHLELARRHLGGDGVTTKLVVPPSVVRRCNGEHPPGTTVLLSWKQAVGWRCQAAS